LLYFFGSIVVLATNGNFRVVPVLHSASDMYSMNTIIRRNNIEICVNLNYMFRPLSAIVTNCTLVVGMDMGTKAVNFTPRPFHPPEDEPRTQ